MYKLLFMFKRKSTLTFEQFVDYYEQHHVKIGYNLIVNPMYYSRKYLRPLTYAIADGLPPASEPPFDVVMEVGFAREADYLASLDSLSADDLAEIRADEDRFMDRAKQVMFVVDERVSPVELFASNRRD